MAGFKESNPGCCCGPAGCHASTWPTHLHLTTNGLTTTLINLTYPSSSFWIGTQTYTYAALDYSSCAVLTTTLVRFLLGCNNAGVPVLLVNYGQQTCLGIFTLGLSGSYLDPANNTLSATASSFSDGPPLAYTGTWIAGTYPLPWGGTAVTVGP